MLYTTLNEVNPNVFCGNGWGKLLKSLNKTKPDDEELSFKYILNILGIENAVWYLRKKEYKDYCLFNADLVDFALHFFEDEYPEDKRPRKMVKAIRDYHAGLTDLAKLDSARIENLKASIAAAHAASIAAAHAASIAIAHAASIAIAHAASIAIAHAASIDGTHADAAHAHAASTAAANATHAHAASIADAHADATHAAEAAVYIVALAHATAHMVVKAVIKTPAINWETIEKLFIKHFC